MPLCRYKISHHIFTLVFICIREAACRYAAMRLALIFSTPIFDSIEDAACRCAAMRLALIFSLLYSNVLQQPLAAMPL